MAEPLTRHYGPEIPRTIARMIATVSPSFDTKGFVRTALVGYESLGLMPRGRQIAQALRRFLPASYPDAMRVLLASLDHAPPRTPGQSMAAFLFLPHTYFVADYGVDHFECSMRAQYLLTQRFTAEFSIRPFLERYPAETLAQLAEWCTDPSEDVRRLVSEGTRPRLPWASRLRAFQADPQLGLALLERLKDDSSLYVRRSVANHLNDIGKDHPTVLIDTARRWLVDATDERRWIVRHALRSAVKRGDRDALALLGFGRAAKVQVQAVRIAPSRAAIGGSVQLACEVTSRAAEAQRLAVDFSVGYVKANGTVRPKVFKWTTLELAPRQRVSLQKCLSLVQRTTRTHYPGTHTVHLLINGAAYPLGSFLVTESERARRR
ncbi:MAG: DNA alkylation repair protein [Nitrospiraceae bacterium]